MAFLHASMPGIGAKNANAIMQRVEKYNAPRVGAKATVLVDNIGGGNKKNDAQHQMCWRLVQHIRT